MVEMTWTVDSLINRYRDKIFGYINCMICRLMYTVCYVRTYTHKVCKIDSYYLFIYLKDETYIFNTSTRTKSYYDCLILQEYIILASWHIFFKIVCTFAMRTKRR